MIRGDPSWSELIRDHPRGHERSPRRAETSRDEPRGVMATRELGASTCGARPSPRLPLSAGSRASRRRRILSGEAVSPFILFESPGIPLAIRVHTGRRAHQPVCSRRLIRARSIAGVSLAVRASRAGAAPPDARDYVGEVPWRLVATALPGVVLGVQCARCGRPPALKVASRRTRRVSRHDARPAREPVAPLTRMTTLKL